MPVMPKVIFLLLLGTLAYLTYAGLTIDRFSWDLSTTRWFQKVDPDTLGPIPDILFYLGLKGVGGAAIGIAVIWLWLKGWRAEAFFMLLILIPDAFNIPLREIIGRPRPSADLVIVFGGPQGSSFPSGYALHVTLFCGFLIYLFRYVLRRGFIRTFLWALLGVYIPIVGLWLVYDGRHWTSDVLGGYVYGAFYLVILIWAYRRYVLWRRRYPRHDIPVEELSSLCRPFARILKILY
jgi:undecaprenyl-diphosphatase